MAHNCQNEQKAACQNGAMIMAQVLEKIGAGEGNRTLVISLEGFCSTIELHPHSQLYWLSRSIRYTSISSSMWPRLRDGSSAHRGDN
jgi:hypothetical protein